MFEQSELVLRFKAEVKELNRLKSELKSNRETFGTDEQIETALRNLETRIRDTEKNLAIPSGFDKQVNEIKQKMDNGDLIEDTIVISVLKEKSDSLGDEQILVDGFPRSSIQAESLKEIFLNKNLNIITVHVYY